MGWDNPGMAKLFWNPSILGQGGHMTVHPGIIQGWPSYLGIPRYLDTGGAYGYPSWDNSGILGQGGEGGHMAVHPGILRQGGGIWLSIVG